MNQRLGMKEMSDTISIKVEEVLKSVQSLDTADSLKKIVQHFSNERFALSTSFGMEDQIITEMIFKYKLPIEVFTIDTGRLFEETYEVHNLSNARYAPFQEKKIQSYFPDTTDVETLINEKGTHSFYESIEDRKHCCHIRKVKPLQRALAGVSVWITGIRKQQSNTRTDLSIFEWDESNLIYKFHPLLNWTNEEVEKYILENEVIINTLHKKGYLSIGCAPCTRPVKVGEDIRSGRWWWENSSSNECGLHNKK